MNQILCIALALVVGLLSSRVMKLLKLPNVTGYLISGIIFGPYVLGQFIGWNTTPGSATDINAISWISQIALGFIAFSIGSSFKLSVLKKIGKRVVIITVFEALGGALFVGLFLVLLKLIIRDIPIEIIMTLAAIACATAPAATLMVIRQYKADGPLVRTLLPVVAFDDAVALIAFSVLFTMAKAMAKGSSPNVIDLVVAPLASIFGSLILGGLLGFLVSLSFKLFMSRANRMSMSIAAILICVGVSLLPFNKWIGFDLSISGLLSCMMVGAFVVNLNKDADRVFERMEFFTPPIYILFFVISGANLNLTVFASENAIVIISIAAVYLVSRALGKWTGAFTSAKITKCEPQIQKYLGFTLIPQAGVAIGLATTATQTLVSEGNELILSGETAIGNNLVTYGGMILAAVLISTLVYEIVGPLITKVALTKAGEINLELNK